MQVPLDAFRRLLLANEALQAALGDIENPDIFAARAREAAQSFGIVLSQHELSAALRPDPLGLSPPAAGAESEGWPPGGWLPVDVARTSDWRAVVDWAYFGTERLDAPFFEMSARRARLRPFNRLCRWRTDLDRFIKTAEFGASPTPQGLIFHMSRCGSTLVAQMLAASARNVVLSEAPPIDAMVRLHELRRDASEEDRRRALMAMVAALGRKRSGDDSSCFLKLDSWHSVALPLFRRAFPSTPWLFLYRNPVEVLVSQMRARGMQTVPGMLPMDLQGADADAAIGSEEFCARVLARSCTAAIEHFALGGGLLVNYDELPEAVFSKILPHFGVSVDDDEVGAMRGASLRDAKAPHSGFASDGEEKRRAATQRTRDAAELCLADAYTALESLRSRQVFSEKPAPVAG